MAKKLAVRKRQSTLSNKKKCRKKKIQGIKHKKSKIQYGKNKATRKRARKTRKNTRFSSSRNRNTARWKKPKMKRLTIFPKSRMSIHHDRSAQTSTNQSSIRKSGVNLKTLGKKSMDRKEVARMKSPPEVVENCTNRFDELPRFDLPPRSTVEYRHNLSKTSYAPDPQDCDITPIRSPTHSRNHH